MNIKTFRILFLFNLFIFLPLVSLSAPQGLVQCDGITIPCDFDKAVDTINKIVVWILDISVSVAAISFAYAGGQMIFYSTDPGKRKEAKEIFKKTVIGLLIILSSYLVVKAVVSTLVNDSSDALRYLK